MGKARARRALQGRQSAAAGSPTQRVLEPEAVLRVRGRVWRYGCAISLVGGVTGVLLSAVLLVQDQASAGDVAARFAAGVGSLPTFMSAVLVFVGAIHVRIWTLAKEAREDDDEAAALGRLDYYGVLALVIAVAAIALAVVCVVGCIVAEAHLVAAGAVVVFALLVTAVAADTFAMPADRAQLLADHAAALRHRRLLQARAVWTCEPTTMGRSARHALLVGLGSSLVGAAVGYVVAKADGRMPASHWEWLADTAAIAGIVILISFVLMFLVGQAGSALIERVLFLAGLIALAAFFLSMLVIVLFASSGARTGDHMFAAGGSVAVITSLGCFAFQLNAGERTLAGTGWLFPAVAGRVRKTVDATLAAIEEPSEYSTGSWFVRWYDRVSGATAADAS